MITNIINIGSLLFFIIGFLLFLVINKKSKNNKMNRPKREMTPLNICILIPARDESKVIEGLLKSIQNQTHKINTQNVYVIVEDPKDKTMEIIKQYHAKGIVRKRLEQKRKGYALDEAIKEIQKERKDYDLYFIFDADNILKEDFIEKMLPSYFNGYDIALGYRNCKNGNESIIAACSTLTFSMLNSLINKERSQTNGNIILSGTGYYISKNLINKWKGFPFHSLTEDYELTLYTVLEEIPTYYVLEAQFFDEQPITLKQSMIQRTRWIKGYFASRKLYIPKLKKKENPKNKGIVTYEIVGVSSYIFMIIGLILSILTNFITFIYDIFIHNDLWKFHLGSCLFIILLTYSILVLFSIYLFHKEQKDLNIKKEMKRKAIWIHPLFLLTYIPCAITAILKKDLTWKKIEHHTTDVDQS